MPKKRKMNPSSSSHIQLSSKKSQISLFLLRRSGGAFSFCAISPSVGRARIRDHRPTCTLLPYFSSLFSFGQPQQKEDKREIVVIALSEEEKEEEEEEEKGAILAYVRV